MQTPIPPTKPIPPTPPNINSTSTATNSADTHNSPATTPQSTSTSSVPGTTKNSNTPEKQPQNPATKATEKPTSTSSADTDQTPVLPYLGTNKDTSPKTATAPITPSTNNKPTPSIGWGFFLPFVLIIVLSFFALRWWRNTAVKKRTVLDYSKDNAKELLSLMNSQINADSLPKPTAKLVLKPKVKKEAKGNFEIRI